jgi:hypothetical protein
MHGSDRTRLFFFFFFFFSEDDSAIEEKEGNFPSIALFFSFTECRAFASCRCNNRHARSFASCQSNNRHALSRQVTSNPHAMAHWLSCLFSAGGEDGGAGKGECERQEGRSRAAPLGQRHVVNCDD